MWSSQGSNAAVDLQAERQILEIAAGRSADLLEPPDAKCLTRAGRTSAGSTLGWCKLVWQSWAAFLSRLESFSVQPAPGAL